MGQFVGTAVNEENAAGGRVVRAPTHRAAGAIPGGLHYYQTFVHASTPQGALDLLYTAIAIGMLFERNASISAAEMGCQGEFGAAFLMVAGGLCAALEGSNA